MFQECADLCNIKARHILQELLDDSENKREDAYKTISKLNKKVDKLTEKNTTLAIELNKAKEENSTLAAEIETIKKEKHSEVLAKIQGLFYSVHSFFIFKL